MPRLADRIALITGGNSGIGLATAQLFQAQGARVAITGRDAETLRRAQELLGDEALVMRSDSARLDQIDEAMAAVRERFGRLDVLVANAAIALPTPFAEISEQQFDEINAINYKGVFFTIQKALPLLAAGASVIVVTSISNQAGAPHFSVYAAGKAALRSLVQSLSLELAERGIRVNAISPGPVDTPGFGRWGLPPEAVQAIRTEFERRSPVKRFGTPEEIAQVALFLASTDASYVVGAEIVADGGFSVPL